MRRSRPPALLISHRSFDPHSAATTKRQKNRMASCESSRDVLLCGSALFERLNSTSNAGPLTFGSDAQEFSSTVRPAKNALGEGPPLEKHLHPRKHSSKPRNWAIHSMKMAFSSPSTTAGAAASLQRLLSTACYCCLLVALSGRNILPVANAQDDSNTTDAVPAPPVDVVPTVAPTPSFEVPALGCYADLNQVSERVATKNAFQVETYTLCPNTVYKIGFLGSSGFTEDGFPALTLRQNTRYICGEDGKSSNNCVITGGQFQLLSTFNSFNQEVKANIQIKGITFQDGESAGVLLVAPGDVIFEDCIFREHANVGAASLLFFEDTTRRLLREIDERGLETEAERVKHEVDYYANLLADPVAMEEFRAEVAARRERRRGEDRDLQEIEIVRQNVTFINCHFQGNTYGERSEATNYGAIGVETDDNDCVVKGCRFTGNQFGDVNVVGQSYAVNVALGGTLEVIDSCFVNNDFVGPGAVILQQEQDLIASRGNYGTFDAGLTCQYASVGGECLPFESDSCIPDPTLSGQAASSEATPVSSDGTSPPAPDPSNAERRVVITGLFGVTALLALLL